MEVELALLPRRDERGEGVMGIGRCVREPQSLCDAGDVGVHREERTAEPEQEDHVRRLLPHPREGEEPLGSLLVRELGEEIEGEGPPLVAEPGEDGVEALRPLVMEARALDRPGDLARGGGENVFPGREPGAELGVGAVAVAVGRVLGKNGPHEEIEGGLRIAMVYRSEPATKPVRHLDHLGCAIHDREG